MMQNLQSCQPKFDTKTVIAPIFYPEDGTVDHDFDIGLLSEYLFEEERDGRMKCIDGLKEENLKDSDDDDDADDFSSDDEDGEETADGKRRKSSDGKIKSQDQIDRRRERNRVLARKTRLRKKFFFESLQRQVAQLSMENDMLKGIVKQRMGSELKQQILAECRTETNPIPTEQTNTAATLLERSDFSLMTAIQAAQRSFCITDPTLPDNPIIFASKGFLDLSGYSLGEVLGRNCRFLQGPGTDQTQVEILRKGILNGVDTSICLLNYKADGTPFYNQIFVAGLRDASRKIINYVGVQVEIKPRSHTVEVLDDEDEEDVQASKGPKKGRPKSVKASVPATTKATKLPKASKTAAASPKVAKAAAAAAAAAAVATAAAAAALGAPQAAAMHSGLEAASVSSLRTTLDGAVCTGQRAESAERVIDGGGGVDAGGGGGDEEADVSRSQNASADHQQSKRPKQSKQAANSAIPKSSSAVDFLTLQQQQQQQTFGDSESAGFAADLETFVVGGQAVKAEKNSTGAQSAAAKRSHSAAISSAERKARNSGQLQRKSIIEKGEKLKAKNAAIVGSSGGSAAAGSAIPGVENLFRGIGKKGGGASVKSAASSALSSSGTVSNTVVVPMPSNPQTSRVQSIIQQQHQQHQPMQQPQQQQQQLQQQHSQYHQQQTQFHHQQILRGLSQAQSQQPVAAAAAAEDRYHFQHQQHSYHPSQATGLLREDYGAHHHQQQQQQHPLPHQIAFPSYMHDEPMRQHQTQQQHQQQQQQQQQHHYDQQSYHQQQQQQHQLHMQYHRQRNSLLSYDLDVLEGAGFEGVRSMGAGSDGLDDLMFSFEDRDVDGVGSGRGGSGMSSLGGGGDPTDWDPRGFYHE